MIIKPKIRGFVCTTAHPIGCEVNVKKQIAYTKKQGIIQNIAKRVLIIGSSSGYGLSSRIALAFGGNASTIGIFFEKPETEKKTGTAGFYNAMALDKIANQAGLYSKSLNGDAFSDSVKKKTIKLIKEDLGQIDMLVYSLASPIRQLPETGKIIRSVLKPIGETYTSIAVDTNKDLIVKANIQPATQAEIKDTVTVMGGGDWELWINALLDANVLAKGCKTIAYSYIGTEITWPIYWNGTIGKAKKHLEYTASLLNKKLSTIISGSANIVVLKSVITQASSAIPIMPLYISIVFKEMRKKGIHEGCIENIYRLFSQHLHTKKTLSSNIDSENRLRLDDWELREDIQQNCYNIWSNITSENLKELSDYSEYKQEFLGLFGFGLKEVNYEKSINLLEIK
ncbi:putative reductase [Candidatus Photodesmus katoptron]|uniref:enoyl-ACP reductase FabV n=1 Tax=Candidatus Photodesmus anomalopis TaxID=28176 RepID=UPI0004D9A49A|nr:enoyl-ACP reductase FabV [Candidatus Photodesmus katoptron]KEY90594.1 putative reductase [Candidatus Photodesmus katoptron]